MKLAKGESKPQVRTKKIELELEEQIVEQLATMEGHTKIPRSELVNTALKRFISAHKDYFPGG